MRALALSDEERKKIFNRLHDEIAGSFDAIVKIASEEIEGKIDDDTFGKIKNDIEQILSFSIWGGYLLYSIAQGIVIDENSFSTNKSHKLSEHIGNRWTAEYEKDQVRSLLIQIDPIVSMFLEKAKQLRINELLATYPDLSQLPYSKFGQIDTFVSWAGYQGYVTGLLEDALKIDL